MTKQMLLASAVVLAVSASASAAIVASWSIPTAIPAATTGTNYVYGAADAGDAAAGTSLSAFHALAATTWSSPSGNGSTYSLSSNNWSVGDYYQITVSTNGYSDIYLAWDQTRSSTGPSSFRVDMSTDGTNFTTILASYSVIQAGLAGTNTLAWSVAGTTTTRIFFHHRHQQQHYKWQHIVVIRRWRRLLCHGRQIPPIALPLVSILARRRRRQQS